MFFLAACGEKKAEVDATKEKASAESAAKEKEALETSIDAYIFAYPLVTMEYTRRALTNTAAPEGTKAPMGQFVRTERISQRFVQRCDRTECGHALHAGMVRRLQGAVGG